ncbi:isochorismatase family protein [Neorhizobium sp. NCHU2750]|uniref:cysteine hydrolase family protein n=1 Tax=Neorhizobium sp. NCHU2750 TaxID=1825976 RepID=UPI000E7162D2|nr:isochorismatase [Neorhizobium sp. NCHU2750]
MEIETTAILSIDLQNEYRADGAYPCENYDLILSNARSLMDRARAASVPVIHVQAWVEMEERKNYALLDEKLDESLRSAVAGSRGAEICEEVAPIDDELVIQKRWPSAFMDTNLDAELKQRGIKNLIVVGVWTDSCVRGSVFDAIYKGYRVWLVKDACGSQNDAMHRIGILDMANRLYGGGVLSTVEASKALLGDVYSVWLCTRPIEFDYRLSTIDSYYDAL